MKALILVLYFPIALYGQDVKCDTVINEGFIHSVIFDEPRQEFYFVINIIDGQSSSTIRQYNLSNDSLIKVMHFASVVRHVYCASDGLMYVTMIDPDRLVVYNFSTDDVIVNIDRGYSVRHSNQDYLFVQTMFKGGGDDPEYYKKTGMIALHKSDYTEIDSTFLRATFFLDALEDGNLLVYHIKDWGRANEISQVQLYRTKELKVVVNNFYQDTGILNNISMSYDMSYFSATASKEMLILKLPSSATYSELKHGEDFEFRKAQFVNNNLLVFLETGSNKLYVRTWRPNLFSDRTLIDSDMTASKFSYGRISFAYSDKSKRLIIYSNKSKIIYSYKDGRF